MNYKRLEELLDYEQPNNYIVENTKYNDKYKTPVLTAGQSFILGYTNEENNIFKAKTNPVIIFDDFTTSSRYVDFDFKVKSSAMKILKAKDGINIKYIYYLMQTIRFDNQLHKRYWISAYSKIKVPIPNIEIQDEIVKKLDLITKIVVDKKEQLQALNQLIKSQFVEMFGDPILNNKSWKLNKWNDVLTIKNGKNQKKVEQEDGEYPIYGSGGIMSYANDYICNEDSVIIGRKGNINNPILVRTKFWNVDTAFGLEPFKDKMIVEYLYYFCYFYNFEKHNKAVTIPSLTKTDLLNIDIPIPPIKLQNKFAEFVKQIDKQKFESEIELREMQKSIFYKWGR